MDNINNLNESESTNRIKRGALMSYVSITVSILAGLLYTPWMVQQIGQEEFGIYTLATSLINMFLIDFGLSAAISRFVSKYNAEGDQDNVNNVLGLAYKIYIFIDLFILLVLIIVYFNLEIIYKQLTLNELESFKIVYIIAATFSFISFPFTTQNGILTAYENFVELKLCDLLNKILSVVLLVSALIYGYGLYALVAVNAISGIITILVKFIIIKKVTNVKVNLKYKNKVMLNDIFSFSVWSAIVTIAQRFVFNITPSILGAVSGSISISIFGISSSLEGYVYTIANAINGLFLPKVTRIVMKENASNNLLNLMIKIGRFQLIIIGLITIGFISVGKDFILLWMGEKYIMSYYSTILLILPSMIYLPQQIGNTTIVALNKVKMQAYVFTIMAFVNVILSIIFSYSWGTIGASLAICISYFLRSVGMNIVYYKKLKINIFEFFYECHFKLLLPFATTLIIGYSINFLLPKLSWYNLIFKGSLIIILYLINLWYFGLNSYEKNYIYDSFCRFR